LGWKKQQTVLDISLVMATTALLVSTAAVAAAGGVVPFAIAQEEQASLGEEDDILADGIVSDVLDDQNVVDQHSTAEQDAANTNVDSDVQVGEQVEPPPQLKRNHQDRQVHLHHLVLPAKENLPPLLVLLAMTI
jgi:hypothetical protein